MDRTGHRAHHGAAQVELTAPAAAVVAIIAAAMSSMILRTAFAAGWSM